ncbi:Arabinanase/levansucrase/invertase [Clavulina sp. PMI_390]|nr:Arabinanase/levansucrase/invertase [Clavulina sp. PMI_390]
MAILKSILVLAALVGSVSAYPSPNLVTGYYTAATDPSKACRDNSGTYYLFTTGVGIRIRTSTNRVAWTDAGEVWPNGASWTDAYTGTSDGSLWAPDCTYISSTGTFWLYYSASTIGSQTSAIFLATSTSGASGTWTNQGLVTSTTSANNYNAIDPDLVIDGSNWWLVFGSFWNGIQLVPLNSSTGKLSGSSIYSLASWSNGIEGSGIFKYGSYYYLFASRDKCCLGTSSTYNIRAVRSTSITGPYVDANGASFASGGGYLVLETHDSVSPPTDEEPPACCV